MDTRDSGVIDLFAIHKEEEHRISSAPAAMPSGPPPAVSFDTQAAYGDDADVDALASAQRASRTRAKIIGGVIGAMAVVGICIAAIASGGKEAAKDPSASAAAAQPPAAAMTVPAPAADPAPTPAPPATAKSDDAAYTRDQAIAAASGKPVKGKKKSATYAAKAAGPKMQKIQSGGTN